jgi:tetratricopeptide (TPR) repeat protein
MTAADASAPATDRPRHMLLLPDPKMVEALDIPVMPFRIRPEAMDDVKDADGGLRIDVLVDEWAKVLADDRELRVREGPAVALWANVVATERGRDGDADGAEHYCRLGLQFAPTNLTLQAKLGLALLQQGNLPQALVQFKQVMDDPRTGFSPTLWLAAGRTAMDLGLHAEAVRILEQYALFLPDDDAFWDLLGEARDRAGLGPPRAPPTGRRPPQAPPTGRADGWQEVGGSPADAWTAVDDGWKEVKE